MFALHHQRDTRGLKINMHLLFKRVPFKTITECTRLATRLLVHSKHLSELDTAEHEESQALPHAKHSFNSVEYEENVEDKVQ